MTNPRRPIRRIALIPAQAAILVYLAIDAALNALVRPVWRRLGRIDLVTRLGALIAGLPAYVVLLVLAVPFAVAEPAKVFAVLLMSEGHLKTGLVIMVAAYAVSLLVVDRIYHAGEAKLRTIPWFAAIMDRLFALRDRVLAWARTTEVWQAAVALRRRATDTARGLWRRVFGSGGRREA
jgi:hypothetical protein